VEQRGRVGLVTLNRPKALNALSLQLTGELLQAVESYDRDPRVGCIVITGSDKVFAAGADIKEMQDQSYMDTYASDWFAVWDRLSAGRTPLVAPVAGFALGGGYELAMMCDIILAADTAKFGLGVMPGMGGSQRLTRIVGKAKAAEMCLTGRMMNAAEAERSGLVSRVVPAAELLADALQTAETIAAMSLPIAMMTKESINRSYETMLGEGIRTPLCFVSLRNDHVAGWEDTYRGARQFQTEMRFILGGSGHNAGTVNPPAANKHGYWTNPEISVDAEDWLRGAKRHQGSWWPEWTAWLKQHGDEETAARVVGESQFTVLEAAPGSYVKVRH
jgi:enoyl-CoA hydratase